MFKAAALLAGASLALFATPALAAITYTGANTVGSSGSYTLSVTTDGTIGTIGTGNITSFNITINDSHGSITLTPLNAGAEIGGGLSATATDLLFDFSGSGFALFQHPAPGSSEDFLCFAASLCGNFTNATNLLVGTDFPSGVSTSPMRGNLVIASVNGSVPEPATWAMMLVGFGGIGFAMRRRKAAAVLPELA